MDSNKRQIIVFDVKADFAHYKQIYMTTSALTYPLPFKTAVYGLVAAIIGLEKNNNLSGSCCANFT